MTDIATLESELIPAIAAAPDEAALETIRVAALGKSGSVSALLRTLGQKEFAVSAFIVLNVIVFTETGLLIGFFLPGDSLLVTAGLVCSLYWPPWTLPVLLVTLTASAIIGDSVGYAIGLKTGPKIFSRDRSLLKIFGPVLRPKA